jgi:hypothetical protein
MSNLLIGSSNVARFYNHSSFREFNQYQMMKCTTMDSLMALMTEIEDGSSNNVIISVLENIIVDAADKSKSEEDRKDQIKIAIQKAIGLVEVTATRLPRSKFCIVSPLKRPAVSWFDENKSLIDDKIRKNVSKMKTFNVTRLLCMCSSLQAFDKDGIHLTEDSGQIFVESILKAAEEIFSAVDVNSEKTESSIGEPAEATFGESMEVKDLIPVLKARFESDNLMFARLREEIDSTANKSREDRVVVTGITCKEPLPTENRQRIEKLKGLVAEVFEAIKPGFTGKILYASQGRNNDTLPVLEVKLDRVEHAVAIRKAFAEKRKKEKLSGCLERIFISNSINVGTRVRIEILKAIAKRTSTAQDLSYVASFISRPVMHVRSRNDKNAKPAKTYTFIDAVKQFGSRLKTEDLLEAYAKAGKAFSGQLEQNFVVLKESDSEAAQTNFHKARIQRGRGRGGPGMGGRADRGKTHWNDGASGSRGLKRPGDGGETSSAKK